MKPPLFLYMILILSTPTDKDTNRVIDYLKHNNKLFFRLNDEDLMLGKSQIEINVETNTYIITTNKTSLQLNDVKVVWYRKFGFLNEIEALYGENSDITHFLKKEFVVLKNHLFHFLRHKKWLFHYNAYQPKLNVLKIALEVGLHIPKTIITSNKPQLENFINKNGRTISKAIGDGTTVGLNDKFFLIKTQEIVDLKKINDCFMPSLIQQYIEKDYEIRSFYLGGKFYSMAIFSQSNEQTKIDFRNIDPLNKTRFVPYKLPNDITLKLNQLMKKLGLNTGSFDIVKCKSDNKYYFLEINPAGQFGMTSTPCNYNLHQKVAKYLIKLENEFDRKT